MKLVPHSLRWRLLLWYGVLLVVVLSAFGFTAHHLERTERMRSVDQDLQHRLSTLVSALRMRRPAPPSQPGEPPRPNLNFTAEVQALFGDESGCYYAVWLRDLNPIAKSENAPDDLPRPAPGGQTVRLRAGHLREVFLFAAPADCVLVGRSMVNEDQSIRLHAVALASAGGVLLVFGLLGGSWLVTRAIRPVEQIRRTAAQIAEGDLSQRIPVDAPDSELGQLAGVLNTTFARLDAAFAQQAQFTADAAHELRTPVAVILSETQSALTRERSAPEYRESLESCLRAAQRMRRLIGRLLELARWDAGQEAPGNERIDLAAVAAECIDLMEPLATDRGITIRRELSPAPCHGDPARLSQVVANLMANAIQHSHDGGEVCVITSADDWGVVLTVVDNGPGIAAEDLSHVFERFYRADKARTSSSGRTGLGLSIAQAIVTAHHGTIEARSEPGSGATFTVRLPAAS